MRLAQLLPLLRKHGVHSFDDGTIKITLAPLPQAQPAPVKDEPKDEEAQSLYPSHVRSANELAVFFGDR